MRSFTYSIHIDRAPETVWAYMMDFTNASRWRNLVRTIEPLTPPPLRVGSQLRVTYDLLGTRRSAISEIWAYEPPRRFGVRNTERGVTGAFHYQLAPEDAGTRVTFTCDITPHGPMWLVLPWLIRGNRRRYRQQLSSLKAEVERGS